MGKKVKTGKSRRDKFYHLAKESGYRSRAAFKLLQLNRKFGFLQQSRVVIDLCAAPGGWLQVVRECAPVSGLVIGVDLVPIRPVPNVKTLVADITTAECRALLRKELQHLKADCVLHDGAPNVGTDWGYDEFAQASLCHQALLLATDFLRRGGTFVTKVFRSADYEKLKFVLLQLFKNVRAAKPEASRLESAEIYLICQGYRAPDQLDPAFRDVTKVFGDVAAPAKPAVLSRTFGPMKKQKAQGYTELDGRLVDLPVSRFLNSEEPLQLLASCGRVVFDLAEVERMATPEIVECCKDIKVLGKAEVASLLQWRRRLLERLRRSEEQLAAVKPSANAAATGGEAKSATDDVTIAEAAEDAEMQKVDQLVSKVAREEQLSAKKKAKKAREAKKRLNKRIQLSMVHQGDTIEQSDDIDLFSLARVRRLLEIEAQAPDVIDAEDADDEAATAAGVKRRVAYHSRESGANVEDSAALVEPRTKRPRLSAATSRVGDDADDPDNDNDDEEEDGDELESVDNSVEDADDDAHPLITSLEDPEARRKRRAESWFAQPAFAELEAPSGLSKSDAENDPEQQQHLFDKRWSDDEDDADGLSGKPDKDAEDSESDIDRHEDEQSDAEEQPKMSKKQKRREQRQQQLTTPEELAIATRIATSRRQRREIVESGFHRFMFNDDNLPAWFVADEKRHMRPCPVRLTKSELDPQAKRLRGVNVRTIKKVVEAKARKKMKAAKRMEKVRKRAEAVLEQEGVVDAEKNMQVRQLYKRSGVLARKKRPVVYAVSKRSGAVSRKQAATKGSFVRRVDVRMKKDKRSAAAKKGGNKQSRGKNNKRQKKR